MQVKGEYRDVVYVEMYHRVCCLFASGYCWANNLVAVEVIDLSLLVYIALGKLIKLIKIFLNIEIY